MIETSSPQPVTGPVFIETTRRTQAAVADTGRARSWRRAYARRLLVTDVLSVLAAIAAGHLARFGPRNAEIQRPADPNLEVGYAFVSVVLALVWLALLWTYGTRDRRIVGSGPTEYKRIIDATMLLLAISAVIALFGRVELARAYLLIVFPLGLALMLLTRWGWREWLISQRRSGLLEERAILVGSPGSVEVLARELARNKAAAYQVVGAITPDGRRYESLAAAGVPVLGSTALLMRALTHTGARTVIVTGSDQLTPDAIRDISWSLDPSVHNLLVSPSLTDIGGPRISVHPVAGLPLLSVETPHYSAGKALLKRALDLVITVPMFVILLPVFAVLAALVRFDSPGPVFFRQERVGYKGMPFMMFKFRSMVPNAEERLVDLKEHAEERLNDVLFKMTDDPRVTRIGRTLRRFSLDELPQLWNVIKGDMSLVGPRPPLQTEVEKYDERVHRKFFVKPGLTGLWQVSGRSNLSWDDSVRLDLFYVENWSIPNDIIILWRTIRAVIRHEGAF